MEWPGFLFPLCSAAVVEASRLHSRGSDAGEVLVPALTTR